MRRRSRAPLLLTMPTRAADLPRGMAIGLTVLIVAVLIVSIATAQGGPVDPLDGSVQAGIVDAIRHGGHFYAVASDAVRSGDTLGGWAALPLPTLAVVLAAIPLVVVVLLLWALAAGVLLAWADTLRPALISRRVLCIALVLLAVGMAGALDPARIEAAPVWAGLLVALSLGRWRGGRSLESVAFGLAAALVADLAAPYIALMAIIALLSGDRREAAGWSLAAGLFALAFALHVRTTGTLALPAGLGWHGGGAAFAWPAAIAGAMAEKILPIAIAIPIGVLGLVGWVNWRHPLGGRVTATLVLFAALAALSPPEHSAGIAMIAAPLWLLGLIFAADALRDLGDVMRDRRRITVTRVVR